ncbi:hypothetical protein BXZ70DRAFT_935740 [Cristinia sonorae]|uniref:Uncharacterized protein n=1 Tax=Cristinia sonorae TaxID=1940300 RepID=A0A8K0XQ72_9AGAR|nr:hypothetical protein BXZ70DRAFT_935740 [Cristinia sonorae]
MATSVSASVTGRRQLKTEYHHYVPQFMLKKWAVPFVPPPASPSPRSPGKKGKGRGRKNTRSNESCINTYDTDTDTIRIGTPVARAFGASDMYKDHSDAENVYRIEELFSKLESQTALVLRKLDLAISGPDTATTAVSLTRKEVNTLRKFLFLLSYRTDHHARQFLEERFDAATAQEVETFRQRHNLKDSYAVYLFNLRNFLLSEHWEISDDEKILKSDRDSYKTSKDSMQLAFYVVPDDAEFIITNNGLGLWEGTNLPFMTLLASVMFPGANPGDASWRHTLTYPVSPRLLVMLRNIAMMQQPLQNMGISSASSGPSVFGDRIPDNSYFKDFPRTNAEVTYDPPISRARLEALLRPDAQDQIGKRVKDILKFQIHQLNAEQARRVNCMRLENQPKWITYKSPSKLLASIEQYDTTEGTKGSRNWAVPGADPKAGMGFGTMPVYTKKSYASLTGQLQHFLQHGSLPSPPNPSARPQPTASSSVPPPPTTSSTTTSSSPRPQATRSTTAPLSAAETRADGRAAGMSFIDLLQARDTNPTMEKPIAQGEDPKEAMKKAHEERRAEALRKPRKPMLRRQVYAVRYEVKVMTEAALKVLGNEFMK